VWRDLAVGIHAVYELPPVRGVAAYPIATVARHLAAINAAWKACFEIATNPSVQDFTARDISWSFLDRILKEEREEVTEPNDELGDAQPLDSPVLMVRRLHIGSPLDLELLVQGSAAGSAILTGLYLLYRAVRKPKQLGGWLPGVLAGWVQGMQEVDEAKRLRKQYELGAGLTAAAEQLSLLEVVEVELLGVDTPSAEIDGSQSGQTDHAARWSCPDQSCPPAEMPPTDVTEDEKEFRSDPEELLDVTQLSALLHMPSYAFEHWGTSSTGPPNHYVDNALYYRKWEALRFALRVFDLARCSGTCHGIYPRNSFVYIED
jgi:hypothetical protein